MVIDGNDLLTAEELARRLKVPVGWIYDHCRPRSRNRVPGFKLGKYWRFREQDVVGWLERQQQEGPRGSTHGSKA
jgi:excisionase family DNA binding protein